MRGQYWAPPRSEQTVPSWLDGIEPCPTAVPDDEIKPAVEKRLSKYHYQSYIKVFPKKNDFFVNLPLELFGLLPRWCGTPLGGGKGLY